MKPRIIYKNFILSISFGNFLKGNGGTDLAISEQMKIFNDKGISYVQIAPIKPGNDIYSKLYTIVLDGHFYGIDTLNGIIRLLIFNNDHILVSVFINHLNKWRFNDLINILNSTGEVPIYYFLHDFYTICQNGNFLRNGNEFCGFEKPSKKKCSGCVFYNQTTITKYKSIFLMYYKRLHFVAPSEFVKNAWLITYPEYNSKITVIPHQVPISNNNIFPSIEETVNIAYVGALRPYKGSKVWEVFQKLCVTRNLPYNLFCLSKDSSHAENVKNIKVNVTQNNPCAMVDALKKNNIAIVFLCSACPETYSYTYQEAHAANAFVITLRDSGNIAYQVEKNSNGKVLDNTQQILDYFSDVHKVVTDLKEFQNRGKLGPFTFETNKEMLNLPLGEHKYKDENIKSKWHLSYYLIEKLYRIKNNI